MDHEKMCYLYAMEFYSSIKMSEILLFSGKWMEQESITLSEVRFRKTKVTWFLSHER
jgi:hypothetical protein